MGLVTEPNYGTPTIGSHEIITEGSELDLGQQVHTEIGSGIGPVLGEGVVMTGTIGNREKRLPMHVKSSNQEI